ncbi:MAG: hypothetical protein R2939_22700 [Kofleriaceae bacterium]
MPIPEERRRSHVARQVASMVLSCVHVESPMAMIRAAAWHNGLARVGLHLPLFVIHDLGVLLSVPRGSGGVLVRARTGLLERVGAAPAVRARVDAYVHLLEDVAGSEVAEKLAGLRLRDELVAVLLTRLLGDVFNRWRDRGKTAATEPMPLDLGLYDGAQPAEHFADFDPAPLWRFLEHLTSQAMHVYTAVELIDLDTVRLLGLFKDDSGEATLDLVDLSAALGSPEAHDVASFSLELLPSVLETRRATGVQSFAVDGYASIERAGNVDSLVLSELAYDREVFEQKVVDAELLYYGRDREHEEERRLQYVLVDSSASMRGQRQVFARGLALTLIKKLSLEGDEIWLRFFDSRLHELVKAPRAALVPVPYLLSFRSERGRNYGKVFRQLLVELERLGRDRRRQVVLYVVTHGHCHIAPEIVSALRQHAYLYGIVIQPSGELPEWSSAFDRCQVVTLESLGSRTGQKRRALDIVTDASATRREARAGGSR